MALYTTFGELKTRLRAEARMATNPAVGASANTRHETVLNRVYATLYDDYDWPHLRFTTPLVPLLAGSRYYEFPAGINHNRVEEFTIWQSGQAWQIDPGIGTCEYASFDSEGGVRADPPQRWDIRSTSEGSTQIEIWPLPASNDYSFQIKGTRAMSRLVNSSDLCLLDDHMVVLYAAAEVVAPVNKAQAATLFAAAETRRLQLRGRAVAPQGPGTTAPTVGRGTAEVGLQNGRATVRISG